MNNYEKIEQKTMIEKSKRQMIKEIVEKSKNNNDRFYQYELQIMAKPFVEHLYRWYIKGEKVEEYDLR